MRNRSFALMPPLIFLPASVFAAGYVCETAASPGIDGKSTPD